LPSGAQSAWDFAAIHALLHTRISALGGLPLAVLDPVALQHAVNMLGRTPLPRTMPT